MKKVIIPGAQKAIEQMKYEIKKELGIELPPQSLQERLKSIIEKPKDTKALGALEVIKDEGNGIINGLNVDMVEDALIKGSESEKENARLKDAISALVEKYDRIYKSFAFPKYAEVNPIEIVRDLKSIVEVK